MIEMLARSALVGAKSVVQALTSEQTSPAGAVNARNDVGFDAVFRQVTNDAISSLKAGEAASISGIQGKESAQRVVEAVMSAQQSLQTAVAIRDKVVQAYQEVVRMAI